MIDAERDNGYHQFKSYTPFSRNMLKIKMDLIQVLSGLKGKKIIAYGASAKGINLLNYCGITKDTISVIMDDTPSKQGKYTPGSNIQIRGAQFIRKPDYILLLAWNFSKELIEKSKHLGAKYILPIPEVKIL